MASTIRTRFGGLASGLAIVTLLGAAVAFAVADQTSRVLSDLATVQSLEGAETDTALYRANLAIAVAATANGDLATVQAAVSAADSALDRIEAAFLADLDLGPDLAVLRHAVSDIGAALSIDDRLGATAVAIESAGPALNRISQELGVASAAHRAAIEAEREDAGRVARLSSFSAALIAPALVLWAYRSSSRRRLEHQKLEDDLKRSRDLSRAKDELIAGLSHQLRTPLTGIQGFSSALLDQAASGPLDPDLVAELMQAVYHESVDLGRMIDDFLVVSRDEAGALAFVEEETSINEALRPTVELLERTGNHLVVDLVEMTVLTDPARLRHLIRNIAANALAHGRGPFILRGRGALGTYLLQVIDHGRGMNDGQMEQAIKGFVHSPRETTVRGSLGLGLHAAWILALGIGSRLEYRHEDGQTIFAVRLPLARAASPLPVSYSATPG